jgi:ABC-type sugar transport system substrate-binding protein
MPVLGGLRLVKEIVKGSRTPSRDGAVLALRSGAGVLGALPANPMAAAAAASVRVSLLVHADPPGFFRQQQTHEVIAAAASRGAGSTEQHPGSTEPTISVPSRG